MAGDWLKIEVSIPDKPEVWQIAGLTGLDPDAVVGKLIKVWRWFDAHTENGNAAGVTYALVDSITGVTGFAEAMAFSGWLAQEGRTLTLPNFDRHNGKTAKNRALTAKRVAKSKAKSNGEGNAEVTLSALPREEKRREEEKDIGASADADAPAPKADPIPYQRLADLYNETMTGLPKALKLTDQRRAAIRKAWNLMPETRTLAFWEDYFAACQDDPFLNGTGPYGNGHENWRPDLEYLLKPKVVVKVYEKEVG